MSTKAKVTPKIIIWARETVKMSIETVSTKMSIPKKRLEDWENGISYPTIKQAQKLAKIYRRPFAIFFFLDMPEDFHPLRDFRRKTSTPLQTASVFIIRDIQQKQAWMSENLIENNQLSLPFVGKFSIKDDPILVAKDILKTLGINPTNYAKGKTPLNYWISKAEKSGINISRTSYINKNLLIDPNELQGFAIVDQYAPFIFINSKDWESAQLFTLVHELAHIWIGVSGISNEISSNKEMKLNQNMDPIELYCSNVSANVLMPEEFMKSITISDSKMVNDIYGISKNLGVSSFAFLYRMFTLGMISKVDYFKTKDELDERFSDFQEIKKNKTKSTEDLPIYYPLLINKNGKLFIQVVLNAYRTGDIEVSQASFLLNVKANNLGKLEEKVIR
jgi:Zn-dependent peptidase ImmA (M78 family)/transcriptional regulator with XRE-family HTH domain